VFKKSEGGFMKIDKKDSLLAKMAKGEYPKKTVSTVYGDFVLQYPSGRDNGIIARRAAVQLNGLPRNSFGNDYLSVVHRDCTLSVVINEYPEEFPEEMRKENIDEFPDEEVKNLLLKEFYTFFRETQKGLSGKS
jgi:hypothetical protein